MRNMLGVIALAALLCGGPALAQRTNDLADMMRALGGGMSGKKLAKAISKASAFPLGSRENPVRSNAPTGERAYLARLRCADGAPPAFNRDGSAGAGPYGYIVDIYTLKCAEGASTTVYMDMYHDHVESAAVPGFTIVPEGPTPA